MMGRPVKFKGVLDSINKNEDLVMGQNPGTWMVGTLSCNWLKDADSPQTWEFNMIMFLNWEFSRQAMNNECFDLSKNENLFGNLVKKPPQV